MRRIVLLFALVAIGLIAGSWFDGHKAQAAPGTKCGNATWVSDYNLGTAMPWHWRLNNSTIPGDIDPALTLQHMRNAHTEWELSQNYCGFGDNSSANFTWDGYTSSVIDACHAPNVVMFGLISALAQTFPCVSGGRIVAADIVLSTLYKWSNASAVSGRYDVWSVLAHEIGHELGASRNHFPSPDNVMYYSVPSADLSNRLLGKGDYYFNGFFY